MRYSKLLGRRSREHWGKNSKKEIKLMEKREWRKDYSDEELYPELEEDERTGPQWVWDIIDGKDNG